MSDAPSNNLHNNPDETPRPTQHDPVRDSTLPVIVDEYGNPIRHADNPKDKETTTEKEILDRVKIGERWMILLTAIVACSTVFQSIQSCNNNASTSKQVDKIIVAADRIDDAADSFSGSAAGINGGVRDAVGKLNLQADKLAQNVTQTSRLAKATETANANVIASDRPWIGGVIQVSNFEVGKSYTMTTTWTNSGKRPAMIDVVVARAGFYRIFPFDPNSQFITDNPQSTGILVPGQIKTSVTTLIGIVKQNEMDMTEGIHPLNTFFAFAKIEYRDLQTNEPHFTHACIYYVPRLKTGSDLGFRDCKEYNDAK